MVTIFSFRGPPVPENDEATLPLIRTDIYRTLSIEEVISREPGCCETT